MTLVQQLEQEQHPLLTMPGPKQMQERPLQPVPTHPLLTPGRPEIPEEPQQDPMEDLALRLGLQPPKT